MLTYIIVSLLIAIAPLASRSERVTNLIASLFALVQVASVALVFVFDRFDTALLTIFRADTLAVVFHVLMIAVLIFSLIHSSSYLRAEKVTTRSYNAYYTLLMLLALSITCVYYSYNLAMTWVFLELTTICSAGIIYHREFEQSLEATWKYIFVCSTGIAMAYLGILLLSTVAVEHLGDIILTGAVEIAVKAYHIDDFITRISLAVHLGRRKFTCTRRI